MNVDELAEARQDAERYRHLKENTKAIENYFDCEYSQIDEMVDRHRAPKENKT